MKLWYFNSDRGCGIRKLSSNRRVAERQIRKELGTYDEMKEFRVATKNDISWVKSMGGYIPE